MKVREIYDQTCIALLEPGGLQLSILTLDDFLEIFSQVIQEWAQATGLIKKLVALPLTSGTSTYTVPDTAMDVQQVYASEKYLGRNPALDLDLFSSNWRAKTGTPNSWHEDRLPPKTIEVNPTPTLTGSTVAVAGGGGFYGTISAISGTDWGATCPGGLYGTISSVSGADTWESVSAFFGTISDIESSIGNLLLVATVKPPQTEFELDTLIECVPDSFTQYLKYGVLAKIFSVDGELRDELRARYCGARFQEGIGLAKAISEEVLESEG